MEQKENPTGTIKAITETSVTIGSLTLQLGEKQQPYWKNYHAGDYVAYNHRNGVTTWLKKADTSFSTPNPTAGKSYAPKAEVKPFVLTEECSVLDEIFAEVKRMVSIWEANDKELKFSAEDLRTLTVTLYIEKNKRR